MTCNTFIVDDCYTFAVNHQDGFPYYQVEVETTEDWLANSDVREQQEAEANRMRAERQAAEDANHEDQQRAYEAEREALRQKQLDEQRSEVRQRQQQEQLAMKQNEEARMRLEMEQKKLQDEQDELNRKRTAEEHARAQEVMLSREQERFEREQTVTRFLKNKEFPSINEPKITSGCMSKKKHYALHECVMLNDVKMAEMLISNGADKSLKNSKGQTPYEFAKKTDKKDSHKIILLLLKPQNAP